MVSKKFRINQNNPSGGYDVLHPETTADQVIVSDGTTVEERIKGLADSVSNVPNYAVASQAEAEAGDVNNKLMTPLRTKQSIDKVVTNWAQNAVNMGGQSDDPDTTQHSYILTDHANSPGGGLFWHIQTYFYANKTGNRAQIALSYNGTFPQIKIRHKNGAAWTPWRSLEYEDRKNVPNGYAGLDANGAITVPARSLLAEPGNTILFQDKDYNIPGASAWQRITQSVRVNMSGVVRVSYNLWLHGDSRSLARSRVYKNGSPVGTERMLTGEGIANYKTYSFLSIEDISVSPNDVIEVWATHTGTSYGQNIERFNIGKKGEILL